MEPGKKTYVGIITDTRGGIRDVLVYDNAEELKSNLNDAVAFVQTELDEAGNVDALACAVGYEHTDGDDQALVEIYDALGPTPEDDSTPTSGA